MARRPNLFLVGAPRCGTTSMHSYLSSHPDIFMSTVKEPHFFSADLTREGDAHHGRMRFGPIRSEEQYLWLFRAAGQQRVVGEASPLYLYSKEAAARIHAFTPDARILVMVREPVAFLESLHGLYLYHLDEDCPSLQRALELEPARRQGRCLPATVRIPSLLYYSELADFAPQIERYVSRFGRDRIHVIVQDDLAADARAVYCGVLAFLGLDSDTSAALPATFERANPSVQPRSRWLARWLMEHHPSVYELYCQPDFPSHPRLPIPRWNRLLPARLQPPLFRLLWRANTRHRPRPPLSAALRAELRAGFAPMVERLSALLDRDLAALWYGAAAATSSR